MKIILKIAALLCCLVAAADRTAAQQYKVQTGMVSFSIIAPASELTAETDSLSGSLDAAKGTIRFTVYVAGFKFTSLTMPELMRIGATYRFHHYYFDSEHYPLATFQGTSAALKKIDFGHEGTYEIVCNGQLSMHETSKPVTVNGTLTVKGGKVSVSSSFLVDPHDYHVRIPESISQFYYKDMKITVAAELARKSR